MTVGRARDSRGGGVSGWRPPGWDESDRCVACGGARTVFGHDPCVAGLPGAFAACCGHGATTAYVFGEFGYLEGPAAARKMGELGGRPPGAAFEGDA